MAIAYTCILVAALLPYLWTAVAKAGGPRYDNRDPRGWVARQESPRVHRANAAHLNAFEAFAPFAAGVLMAQAVAIPAATITVLAVAFVVLRIAHGVLYLTGQAALRSLAWLGALACVLALMGLAIARVA